MSLLLAFGLWCQWGQNQCPYSSPLLWPWANIRSVCKSIWRRFISLSSGVSRGSSQPCASTQQILVLKTFQTRPFYLHTRPLRNVYGVPGVYDLYLIRLFLKSLTFTSSCQTFHKNRGQRKKMFRNCPKKWFSFCSYLQARGGNDCVPTCCGQGLMLSWRDAVC